MRKNNKVFVTAAIAAAMAIGIFVYALNNSKYIVQFDTDGGSKIESQSVKKGQSAKEPASPKKDGYVFVEWQLDGKKYDFSRKVNKNIKLTAKWKPEIYVNVTFDSDGGSEIGPIEILSGTSIDEDSIDTPSREGYTFEGWYVGDRKYDFSKKITSNLTLTAKWLEGENIQVSEEDNNDIKVETEKENDDDSQDLEEDSADTKEDDHDNISKVDVDTSDKFKVGDKVIITGSYAASYDGESTNYNVAVGWVREILAIYEGEEYPYQVGDYTGTTGFCKASSLKASN